MRNMKRDQVAGPQLGKSTKLLVTEFCYHVCTANRHIYGTVGTVHVREGNTLT